MPVVQTIRIKVEMSLFFKVNDAFQRGTWLRHDEDFFDRAELHLIKGLLRNSDNTGKHSADGRE